MLLCFVVASPMGTVMTTAMTPLADGAGSSACATNVAIPLGTVMVTIILGITSST